MYFLMIGIIYNLIFEIMKAKINEKGQIIICSENATESYAIVSWMKNNSKKGDLFKKDSIRFKPHASIFKFYVEGDS